jgi:large subunit ribosomal protein L13
MVVIDAENMVLGRITSAIAKRLLRGEHILVVNAEKAVITGRKDDVVNKLKIRFGMKLKGNPEKGPKFSKMPDKIFKRTVRGMLPHKRAKGKSALKNLRVYIGIPKELQSQEFERIANAENKIVKRFITLEELSRKFGAKW